MNSLAPPVSTRPQTSKPVAIDYPEIKLQSSRLAAYSQLGKPRIALMVLLASAVGYLLASEGQWRTLPLVHASIGILLAVVASSALNQYLERKTDRLMPRTQNRPLPSARLNSREVLYFALACGVTSFAYLMFFVNALTAWLTLSTIILYAACYTPLKRHTSLCTVIGAIPGALPPVLGWTAAGGQLDLAAFSLFAILFIWQFPHFLAIAWIYKDQYEQAGLKMVPGNGRPGIIGAISTGYALVLIPVSLLPVQLGLAGDLYGVVATLLGAAYVWSAFRFQWQESRIRARHVVWVSLAYLPGVLAALSVDHLRLLQ
ncbi:heme o synthase [Planctomicrobium sp. SH661]|uniref:heme o synthase n=1 Tax=Planctomicrobium sp. SH661 TaxID=3448124 RepID=UPI003F5CA770